MDADTLLKPETLWQGLYQIQTLDDFVKAYPPFQCHPFVPDFIRKQLEVVHRLLLFSYFEYRFLDVSLARVLQVAEMALKIRYKELEKRDPPKRIGFKPLVEWADRRGLWKRKGIGSIYCVISETSRFTPKQRDLVASSFSDTIYSVGDYINALYDDVNIRFERHRIECELRKSLDWFLRDGAVIALNGVQHLVYRAQVIYCVIHGDVHEIHVGFNPTFDSREQDGGFNIADPIFCIFRTYTIRDSRIDFMNAQGEFAILRKLLSEKEHIEYRAFIEEYNKHGMLAIADQNPFGSYRQCVIRSLSRYWPS